MVTIWVQKILLQKKLLVSPLEPFICSTICHHQNVMNVLFKMITCQFTFKINVKFEKKEQHKSTPNDITNIKNLHEILCHKSVTYMLM
jgi:hypothetical protein